MTDRFQPFTPWQPEPPRPRPPGPGAPVIVLAVIIIALLLTGATGVAVKLSATTKAKVAASTVPGSSAGSSAPPTAPATTPATGTPSTTAPVAPVSPLAVPPVTAPPVTAKRPSLSASAIAAMVDPAVVDVDTRLAYQHAIAAGTGMVLTPNGIVLTNNHVIDGATTIVAVAVGNGRSYPAQVIGVDPTADVALIQLVGASGLRTITANTLPVNSGDPVVALGNAGGLGGAPTVTSGAVAAVNQSIIASDPAVGTSEQLDGLIETDASLQPGDSGGPLVNQLGQVIGMNTAAAAGNQSATTVSFAIPIGQALAIAHQIEAGQASSTVHLGLPPFLGVQVITGAGAGGRIGALVTALLAGGPAAAAGVAAGSLIVAVNGQPIDGAPTLTSVLRQFRPGATVTVNWITAAGANRSARVTLGTGPAD